MWVNKDKCVKGMKLDIGSGNPDQGEIQPEGFVLNDAEPHRNIDLVCDIRDLLQFIPEGYCSVIRASHIMEHFGTKEVPTILGIIHKLLKPQGKLEIFVPNFVWHSQLLLSGNDEIAVHYAFGGQLDEYDFHKTAFSPRILKKVVEENGFNILRMLDGSSIHCIAERV
jgi:predicted SAM-dependent methyltransferase